MSYVHGATSQDAAKVAARLQASTNEAAAILSTARIEAAQIITEANTRAQGTIDAASQHAANIKDNARTYADKTARRPANQDLYDTLIRERYGKAANR